MTVDATRERNASSDPAAPERIGLSATDSAILARLRRIQIAAGLGVLRLLGARSPADDPEAIHWGPCLRCGHIWAAVHFRYPRVCPACRSPYWDRPRKSWHARKRNAGAEENEQERRHRILRTEDAKDATTGVFTGAASLKLPPPPGPRPPLGSTLSMDDVYPQQPERAVAGTSSSQASLSAQLAERLAAELTEVQADVPPEPEHVLEEPPEPESKSELEPENENEEPPPAA